MPKVKYLNTIRTYDEDGYKRRAGCLCFKSEDENEVFLPSPFLSTVQYRYIHVKSRYFIFATAFSEAFF